MKRKFRVLVDVPMAVRGKRFDRGKHECSVLEMRELTRGGHAKLLGAFFEELPRKKDGKADSKKKSK